MRTAISTWQNRIAPVFDVSGQVILLDQQEGSEAQATLASLPAGSPMDKILFLKNAGVQSLICGAISQPLLCAAENQGMRVHAFIAGDLDEIRQAWLDGCLESKAYVMPGCGQRRRCRQGRRRRNRHGRE
ncbi:MAG: NifB/NifX family molybdenum-iron cluster-binding protein [Candidatus Sumerlaeia bacterium]